MGRKKTDRVVPFYTRLSKKNDKFIGILSKKTGLSRTEWLAKHLEFLQNNVSLSQVTQIAKETRNKVQRESRQTA